jgi:phasin family protein
MLNLTEEAIMSVTPEKIVETGKAKLEASLKTVGSAGASLFAAAEQLGALNVATSRAAVDDGVALIRALLAAKDAKAFAALQLSAIKPAVEKSVVYFGSVAGIFAQTRIELAKLMEAEAFVLGHNLQTALETLFKSAPFGAEAALQALKSAAANATSAYENASQVAKQVSDAAEASVKSATDVAVETVSKNTEAAAAVLKAA